MIVTKSACCDSIVIGSSRRITKLPRSHIRGNIKKGDEYNHKIHYFGVKEHTHTTLREKAFFDTKILKEIFKLLSVKDEEILELPSSSDKVSTDAYRKRKALTLLHFTVRPVICTAYVYYLQFLSLTRYKHDLIHQGHYKWELSSTYTIRPG